jgi:hypothetical protein
MLGIRISSDQEIYARPESVNFTFYIRILYYFMLSDPNLGKVPLYPQLDVTHYGQNLPTLISFLSF